MAQYSVLATIQSSGASWFRRGGSRELDLLKGWKEWKNTDFLTQLLDCLLDHDYAQFILVSDVLAVLLEFDDWREEIANDPSLMRRYMEAVYVHVPKIGVDAFSRLESFLGVWKAVVG